MKRIILIIAVLLPSILGFAQSLESKAYPTGIYIFCGREIPRNFHYLIEKKSATGEYDTVAVLRAPQNAIALRANLLNLPDYLQAIMPIPTELAEHFLKRANLSPNIDSLHAYKYDPKILAAIGCGWFDDGISTEGTYHYRISKVYRTDAVVLGELSQPFPENGFRGKLTTVRFEPAITHITLNYRVSDNSQTSGVALFRSRFMEKDYQIVPAETSYASLSGEMVAVVRDESVAKGMTYSYVAVPFDALGNFGIASDTINVYNFNNMSDIGILEEFNVVADKEKKGVHLNWKMTSDFYIHSYEIYRSKDYDGEYQRVVTLPADADSFFDEVQIDYGDAYFYYMVVSNGYGANLPSARTPVILEGDRENFMPPQNLVATLTDNVVQLSFASVDPNTKGYQIFRGEGYLGELSLIASFSTFDGFAEYYDTLALSVKPTIYSYAVADVNSSFKVSPLSERVTVQYSGGLLPIPANVIAQLRDNEIFIVWDDMHNQNAFISGYNVWRTALENDKTIEEAKIIATTNHNENAYFDKEIIPGKHYRYEIESVALDGETSSRSLHVGVIVPQQLPLSPSQVTAFPTDNSVILRWDNPFDESIQSVRIYRATLNAKETMLKELPADNNTYEDKTVKKGEQYFYNVVTVNKRGEECKRDEPVGVRVRK